MAKQGDDNIPMKESGTITERLTICVEPDLKDLYDDLSSKNVRISELIRRFLREKLPQIRDQINSPKDKD